MIMAESTILEDIGTGKIERQARYFKAKVLTDHKVEGTDQTLQQAIANVYIGSAENPHPQCLWSINAIFMTSSARLYDKNQKKSCIPA